jgi:hypothetical protein
MIDRAANYGALDLDPGVSASLHAGIGADGNDEIANWCASSEMIDDTDEQGTPGAAASCDFSPMP